MKIIFDDVPETQVENLIDAYLQVSNIKQQVKDLAEEIDSNFNDIIFSYDDRNLKRRKLYCLIWDSIEQLRRFGE